MVRFILIYRKYIPITGHLNEGKITKKNDKTIYPERIMAEF